jgi:hypothetical protein
MAKKLGTAGDDTIIGDFAGDEIYGGPDARRESSDFRQRHTLWRRWILTGYSASAATTICTAKGPLAASGCILGRLHVAG